jgi:hypothetical protein
VRIADGIVFAELALEARHELVVPAIPIVGTSVVYIRT